MVMGVVEVLQSMPLGHRCAQCTALCMALRVQVPCDLPGRAARSLADAQALLLRRSAQRVHLKHRWKVGVFPAPDSL